MKKVIVLLLSVALVIGMAAIASAIPIEFKIDGSNSAVAVSNVSSWGFFGSSSVGAELVDGLGSEEFLLGDDQSYTFDFFNITIEAEGFLSGGTADVEARLAFDLPIVPDVIGTGAGSWLTFGGVLSGGVLTWSNMPQMIFLTDGDYFDVEFEDILEWGLGNSTTVSATITAHAGSSSIPSPEPSTMLLLGTGLLGLVTYGRKHYNKRGNK